MIDAATWQLEHQYRISPVGKVDMGIEEALHEVEWFGLQITPVVLIEKLAEVIVALVEILRRYATSFVVRQ